VTKRLGQYVQFWLFLAVIGCATALAPVVSLAAPYAAMVVDARSGKVLHSRNADTQLHPASLTKMMTLYIAFEAIKHGEISLDSVVTITSKASAEPPSKLGLRTGQRIKLRYLIRAAAVKSANDAATAIGIAISGSEAAFARRMNRTAKALGMTRTHFKNANGLTESGHLSTARDMTTLGRHLFYDHPDYYNLFSRRTADAGMKTVNNTNTRFLNAYRGADGIKTGYTRAAGFNLVASAERGSERIITTVFGGRSTASRNAQVAELMDLGFRRAPTRAAVRRPAIPVYAGGGREVAPGATPAGKIVRVAVAPKTSPRPKPRPVAQAPAALLAALEEGVADAVEQAVELAQAPVTAPTPAPETPVAQVIAATVSAPVMAPAPRQRPATITLASVQPAAPVAEAAPEVVTRMSTSGGRHWGVNVGVMTSRYQAERLLLKTALNELGTLDEALRKVVKRPNGWHANFVGLSQEGAELACRRLEARNATCKVIGPS